MKPGDDSVPKELNTLLGKELVFKLKLDKYNLIEGLQDYRVSTVFTPVEGLEAVYAQKEARKVSVLTSHSHECLCHPPIFTNIHSTYLFRLVLWFMLTPRKSLAINFLILSSRKMLVSQALQLVAILCWQPRIKRKGSDPPVKKMHPRNLVKMEARNSMKPNNNVILTSKCWERTYIFRSSISFLLASLQLFLTRLWTNS